MTFKVLVVDDEQDILELIRAALSSPKYHVITTSSGEEALSLVKSESPDIILLDILMVPLSGFDVLDKLRGSSDIPVLVFTNQPRIIDRALALGANGFISKPFKLDELERKIEETLARKA